MKSSRVKSLLAAAALSCCAAGTACFAQIAYSGFWVVGNHATNKCEIVTSNPVIDYTTIWFGSGPYRSRDDAKLARSGIGACPKEDPGPAVNRIPADGASESPG